MARRFRHRAAAIGRDAGHHGAAGCADGTGDDALHRRRHAPAAASRSWQRGDTGAGAGDRCAEPLPLHRGDRGGDGCPGAAAVGPAGPAGSSGVGGDRLRRSRLGAAAGLEPRERRSRPALPAGGAPSLGVPPGRRVVPAAAGRAGDAAAVCRLARRRLAGALGGRRGDALFRLAGCAGRSACVVRGGVSAGPQHRKGTFGPAAEGYPDAGPGQPKGQGVE